MKKLILTAVDQIELSRLSGMVKSLNQQILDIQNKALRDGVKLKDIPSDPRFIPIRQLLVQYNVASCKILQKSYRYAKES